MLIDKMGPVTISGRWGDMRGAFMPIFAAAFEMKLPAIARICLERMPVYF